MASLALEFSGMHSAPKVLIEQSVALRVTFFGGTLARKLQEKMTEASFLQFFDQ